MSGHKRAIKDVRFAPDADMLRVQINARFRKAEGRAVPLEWEISAASATSYFCAFDSRKLLKVME